MKDNVIKSLSIFFGVSTWTSKHPCDMRRFFDFIIISFKEDNKISSDDFMGIAGKLLKNGDIKSYENELNDFYHLYESGFELLKYYKN